MSKQDLTFWQTKTLEQMSDEEWESLCDGCGKCCRVRLQDDETEEIHTTAVACKLLDTKSCRCRDYQNRKKIVPTCLVLRPLSDQLIELLPDTCAYRLLTKGDELPNWHPLISGDPLSVVNAGVSVSGKVISEQYIHADDLEDHIID